MILNLTPHPIVIYPPDTADAIDPDTGEPTWVIEPSGTVAQVGQSNLGTQYLRNCEVPVEYVKFRHANGLPPQIVAGGHHVNWHIVSLAVALSCDRDDLLVPYREVRNLQGTVIGCRGLARPV